MSAVPQPGPDERGFRRFGPSRRSLQRSREQLRAEVLGTGPVPLKRVSPGRGPAVPAHVAVLRMLSRRALFSPESSDAQRQHTGQAIADMQGQVLRFGPQLTWPDLKVLLLALHLYREAGGLEHPEVQLPAYTLARLLREGKVNSAGAAQMRHSLARLTQARFCLLDRDGEPTVGTPDEPVSFLARDERPRAGPDAYLLRGWLHRALVQGLNDPKTASVEYRVPWPVVQRLRGRALLLYLFLECEDYRRCELLPHPELPKLNLRLHHRRWPLREPMLALFGLDGEPAWRARQRLERAARAVWARDGRYEFVDVELGRDGLSLDVWRLPGGPQPDLLYTGRLCPHCLRADPDKRCCCQSAEHCRHEQCRRCAEEFPSD